METQKQSLIAKLKQKGALCLAHIRESRLEHIYSSWSHDYARECANYGGYHNDSLENFKHKLIAAQARSMVFERELNKQSEKSREELFGTYGSLENYLEITKKINMERRD